MHYCTINTDGEYTEGYAPSVCPFALCPKSKDCLNKAKTTTRHVCKTCPASQPDKQ